MQARRTTAGSIICRASTNSSAWKLEISGPSSSRRNCSLALGIRTKVPAPGRASIRFSVDRICSPFADRRSADAELVHQLLLGRKLVARPSVPRRTWSSSCSATIRDADGRRTTSSLTLCEAHGSYRRATPPDCLFVRLTLFYVASIRGFLRQLPQVRPPPSARPVPTTTDLADCTATELVNLYRTRQASPVEATQAVLARIAPAQPGAERVLHRRRGPRAMAARRHPKRAGRRARRSTSSMACRCRSRI